MSEKRKEYDVTVLKRTEVTIYPKLGEQQVQVMITYVAAGLPPRTIIIPKEEYSLEKEKELIRKDIEERLKEKPEVYKV